MRSCDSLFSVTFLQIPTIEKVEGTFFSPFLEVVCHKCKGQVYNTCNHHSLLESLVKSSKSCDKCYATLRIPPALNHNITQCISSFILWYAVFHHQPIVQLSKCFGVAEDCYVLFCNILQCCGNLGNLLHWHRLVAQQLAYLLVFLPLHNVNLFVGWTSAALYASATMYAPANTVYLSLVTLKRGCLITRE